ncbi:MAG: helix-turn-helix domain-containing protein [Chitinophagaceae bacterium]|nr:helix-turn-helix domain-containing protein [Chitinophagaceae bacterium]
MPVFLFLVMGFTAFAQNQKTYESISIAQGLSQGMVYDILQDKEGFIWVGTKDGLNRYDGYTFKVFTNDPANTRSLSSNSINKLFEDNKGRIWAGTENEGLNIYDKKSGDFLRIKQSAANPNGLSGNVIKLMEELPDGRMLIAADDGKINIVALKDNFLDKNTSPVITVIAMPNNTNVYGIGIDKSKTIWIGGMDGTVYKFDAAKNSFTLLPGAQLLNNGYLVHGEDILINGNLYLYNGNEVTPLFDTLKKPEGNILFRPNSSLWDKHHRETSFYDVSAWGADKKIQWGLKLPDKRIIYPFVFDKSGLIWCGTVGYGLRKYNIDNERFNTQLFGFSTYNIIPVTDDDFFIGDVGYTWKRSTNKIIQERAFENLPQVTQIDNFIIASTGDYWFKSDNKGYFKYNPVTKKLTPYPAINNYQGMGSKQPIMEDSKQQIWFPGLGGNITLLNVVTEKITTFNINTNAAKKLAEFAIITSLYEDKNGTYWIGTVDGFANVQLAKTPGAEPQIKWYYNNSNPNSLNYNHVSCFLDDPSNSNYLWICTKGGGLNRLEKSSGNFFHLTVKDGLPDNVVYGILTDDAGNIWGSTNRGIFCLSNSKTGNKESWAFRNFSKEDGLQDDEFNTNAYKKMPNGNLAFGGVNGLNIFNPKEILAKNYKPQVFITNILVGNLPALPNDKTGVLKSSIEQTPSITLNYLQDILTLEFSSLDFTAPAQNKYRYQLVGVDKEWVESGTRRTATYLHLPPGSYTFKVQGSNSQGMWSPAITELKITVNPPWWRTWWAYLLYALLIGFGVRTYFLFRINKAKLQNQLHYEQQEAKRIKELDTVKTQLYANITHEFRTPLTVILGMAQQVKAKPSEHLDAGMDMIVRNGNHLLNLVNEMLDLSKLEDGKMTLHLVNGDVINFLRYIVESFQSLAASQQKQFHFLSDADELTVAYDAEKLRQIITNLLSNALKFTPAHGNVYVSISQEETTDADTIQMILKVKDTGIGIPENQVQHIFDRFYQLDNSHTRKAEGTGIGLALTKELVKLMNGIITVKSPAVGATKGTEFTITLPLQKANVEEQSATDTAFVKESVIPVAVRKEPVVISNEHTAPSTPLILLVEDNVDVVAYTASCLPQYKLAVGKDGKEGFEIAVEVIPDLIITDVMMPFIDGFEMCKKLRQDERTSHIPIIMLTAKADMQSKLEGLEKGADVYLEKPFHKEELLVRIKKLLELRKNLQQYYSKQIGITLPAETAVSNDAITTIIEEPAEHEFVKKVRELVEANFTNYEFSVEQLCKMIFMSHSQLHRKLEALTGCSPNKFIRIVRLNKARELLANPSLSIAAIALDCGYNDPGYFARVFKQEFGITPQEWRGNIK